MSKKDAFISDVCHRCLCVISDQSGHYLRGRGSYPGAEATRRVQQREFYSRTRKAHRIPLCDLKYTWLIIAKKNFEI